MQTKNSSFPTPCPLIPTEMDKQTFNNQTTEHAQHAAHAGYVLFHTFYGKRDLIKIKSQKLELGSSSISSPRRRGKRRW